MNVAGREGNAVVSICCITYNHGQFIAQALDSFLNQKTDFEYEILIHDDASTDDTQEIIKKYTAKYPDKIFPLLRKENVFSKGVRMINRYNFERAKGQYMAMCEGDDYWTDPYKLQKQVDFLEANPDFVMSFHAVEILRDKKINRSNYPIPKSDILEFNDILYKNYIATCSLMFKKECRPNPIPNWVGKCVMGDFPLFLLVGNQGKIKYFPEKMGVYRKHEKGITANPDQKKKGRESLLIMYKGLRRDLGRDRYLPLTLMILKMHLGKLKDFLGLNPSLK